MTIGGFLVLLLIAAVAGAHGRIIGGLARGGCLVSVIVGFAGAWIGVGIARRLGLPPVHTRNLICGVREQQPSSDRRVLRLTVAS